MGQRGLGGKRKINTNLGECDKGVSKKEETVVCHKCEQLIHQPCTDIPPEVYQLHAQTTGCPWWRKKRRIS